MHFLKADKLFNGQHFLPDNPVLVLNERKQLSDIIPENTVDQGRIEKFNGILTPGFINAHCHAELSHLKGKIPQKTGLPGFGKQIILIRNGFHKEEIKEHIAEADKEMWNNGIVAVGDICNTNDSFEIKTSGKIFYHSFIELLALNPIRANDVFDAGKMLFEQLNNLGLKGSLAPHAPYSTSNDLIKKISTFNLQHHLPGSIHNQETEEEDKFFHGKKGGFNDLYDFLQMDISWFKPPMTSSLQYYADSLLDQKTILVHNTLSAKEDIAFVRNKNVFWCFCPNANKYIEDRLPDFSLFSNKNSICLGTDSLASNTQLDLTSEANLLLSHSDFSLEDVLKSMTSTPAKALNMQEHFGSLITGKNTGINLIEYKNNQITLLKKIT